MLVGQRLEEGGVRMTSSRIELGPGSGPYTVIGRVSSSTAPTSSVR